MVQIFHPIPEDVKTRIVKYVIHLKDFSKVGKTELII